MDSSPRPRDVLSTAIRYVKGVGPRLAERFATREIRTVQDALYLVPRRYEDRRRVTTISNLAPKEQASFVAQVLDFGARRTGPRKQIFEVMLGDDTGQIVARWFRFHQKSFQKRFARGDRVRVAGRVELYRNANPTAASDAGTAISSTNYADIEGKPRFRDITQVKIELQLRWNTSLVVAGSNGYPNMANAPDFVDKRNAAVWLGFPIGSVKVDGVSVISDKDEYVRLTYSLLFDPWFHMEQRPDLLEDQQPKLNATGNADPVNWYQPYPDTFDFTQLFGAYENKWIQDGWQAWASPGVACASELAAATAPTDTTKKTSPRYTPAP